MDTGLNGKTALVTGGGTGIGRAIALALAAEGVHVAIASRNPRLDAISEIEAYGVKALRICRDLSEESQVIKMVKTTLNTFGVLDLYVNNAAWTWHEPITKIETESWINTQNINMVSCMWACREICKHMLARGSGSILIVGSTAQYHPAYSEAAYHASKAALRSYMQTLSVEMAPYGIRVNQLVPGSFPTQLNKVAQKKADLIKKSIPMGRLGVPQDCGPAAALLLSDKLSPYTTGTELVISGGLHLRPPERFSESEILAMNQIIE